jgi:hypothetical protein
MKIMFNDLDQPFELSNPKYGREAQQILDEEWRAIL